MNFSVQSTENQALAEHPQQFTTIAVAPGDGIGPEIMNAVLSIFRAVEVPLLYDLVDMGKSIFDQGFSTGITPEAKEKIERYGILFKGPMETPKGKGVKSINVTARKVWNTYANKRVFRTLNGVDTVFSRAGIPINLTIVRENIEDTYGGIEHLLTHDVALCRRFITRPGCEKVHRYAFEMARRQGAKLITCGHKANIMKLTDGMFLDTFYEVAKDYPDMEVNDIIVDDLSMKLVVKPHLFDVIVLPNLQGDIVSDLCAGLVGGLGFAPSANIGDHISIFEAVHGTAPDIAGRNIANPTALLMSGCMMLRHLNLNEKAVAIENAMRCALEKGAHTGDFGDRSFPTLNTTQFAEAVIAELGNLPKEPSALGITDGKPFARPERMTENILLQSPAPQSTRTVGMDLFVQSDLQPDALAAIVQAGLPKELHLTVISNRGTQVWPTGSIFTLLVNQYRARIEGNADVDLSSAELLELAARLNAVVKVCSVEMLHEYDGKRAFSLAQGQ